MEEWQLKALPQQQWGYLVNLRLSVLDRDSLREVFRICDDYNIDYRHLGAWESANRDNPHQLLLTVDAALEDAFRAAVNENPVRSALVTLEHREVPDQTPFRREGVPRNTKPPGCF